MTTALAKPEITRTKFSGDELCQMKTNKGGLRSIGIISKQQFKRETGLKGNALSDAYNAMLRNVGTSATAHLHNRLSNGMQPARVRQLKNGGEVWTLYPKGHYDWKRAERKPRRAFTDKRIEKMLNQMNIFGEKRQEMREHLQSCTK